MNQYLVSIKDTYICSVLADKYTIMTDISTDIFFSTNDRFVARLAFPPSSKLEIWDRDSQSYKLLEIRLS